MTFPFSNSITGADGALIRPAIKSPNFVTLVSGWSINKDGTAEFLNATIRGTIVVGTPGEGQITITDVVPPELQAFYSDYTRLSESYIRMDPQEDASYHYEIAGFIASDFIAWNQGWVDNTLAVREFMSQSYFPSTGVAEATMGNASGGDDSRVLFDITFGDFMGPVEFEGAALFDSTVEFVDTVTMDEGLALAVGTGVWTVDGNSQGFGIMDAVVVTTTGNLVTGVTTQTDVPELVLNVAAVAGRTYEIGWQGAVVASVLTDTWTWSVRLDTALTGTQIGFAPGAGSTGPTYTCFYRPVVSGSHSIHFSIARSAGSGTLSVAGSPGAGDDRSHCWVRDVSDQTIWRNA